MTKNLLIIGAGRHARSILDIVESQNEFSVIGMIDSTRAPGDIVWDYPILGSINDLTDIVLPKTFEVFIAVGDNFQRYRIFNEFVERFPDTKFATLKHASAYVSQRSTLSPGAAVMAGAVVNAACDIGAGAIVNTRSSIDHDGVLAAFASLAPGAVLGGNVAIGERTSIGIGATVVHNVEIGHDVCVGAGSLVLQSVSQNSVVVFGVPCRVVRNRKIDEAYL